MSELPAPSATRLKSPSWLDGRLVIGVVLVLLSVVVGAKIIASSQRYDVMWAASRDIAPGTTLIKADLLQVNVRFKDHGAAVHLRRRREPGRARYGLAAREWSAHPTSGRPGDTIAGGSARHDSSRTTAHAQRQ